MIPFQTFVAEHGALSESEFLGKIDAPHVLITQTQAPRDSSGFMTVKFTKETISESSEARGVMILPVAKREGANAFGMMITIGRATNNDLVIEHQKISKFHAYFRQVGTDWRVCDANSRNGTEVADEVLEPGQEGRAVRSGQRVRLGKAVELVFLSPADLFARVAKGS